LETILGELQTYDSYFSGGIHSRTRGIQSDARRVMRSVELLREKRIQGYALLEDFLQRTISPTVDEAQKISERVRSLRDNIRDRLNLLRSKNTGRMMVELRKYAEELTNLSRGADVVGVIAGTYYLSSMLASLSTDLCSGLQLKCPSGPIKASSYFAAFVIVVLAVRFWRNDKNKTSWIAELWTRNRKRERDEKPDPGRPPSNV
jgi:uncharacterized membrane-anchored protein